MATSLNTGLPVRDAQEQQVHFLRKNYTFADVATTVTIGKIPAGASVVAGGVHVTTA